MFEEAGLDRRGVLAAAEANLRIRRAADFELLQIAVGWADLHPEESLPPAGDDLDARRRRLADEVGVQLGGEGTPLVLAHCPGELGLVLETTYTGAKHLIADALDLRHRLTRLWETVESGRVAAWKARRVAAATRSLTTAQAAEVDAAVGTVIATLGWTRFEMILDATIKRADPEGARADEEQAATRRFVAVGRANDHHIMTLIARGQSLDILSFMATVNRIAEILAAEGDTDTVDIRRSKAIGILARPARALELLARHRDNNDEDDPLDDDHVSLELDRPPSVPDRQPCRCGPRIQLHVHLTEAALRGADPHAICRVEGVGPVTAHTVRRWLGRADASISVRPVPVSHEPPADAYEIPQRIREALLRRSPASTHPWSQSLGRTLDRITPSRMCRWIAVVHRVRPTWATWVHSAVGNTGTSSTAMRG